MTATPTLLWVGLGNMGRGMCKNIVEKGNLTSPLLVYNRSIKRTQEYSQTLPAGKATVVENLADAVPKADVIFTCIANDEAVNEVIESILSLDLKGKLFVDCSTIHPDTTQAIADKVITKGAEFVAVPVFGAPAAADAGQLIAVMAGPKESVERARPWFKGVTSKAEIDLSGQPYGKATTLKVIGNTFVFNMVEQLAEAHVLAEKSGLGTEPIHQLVSSLFPGPYTAYSTRMITGDYHKREEPLFAVDLARKDIRHARSLAQASGTKMQNLDAADAHLAGVKEHCGPSGDIAGIYGAMRKEAGLKFEVADREAWLRQAGASNGQLRNVTTQQTRISASHHHSRASNTSNKIANMASGYSIFIGLFIVLCMCAASWAFAPKGEYQVMWRSSLILAIVSCYLMWAVTFLAQLHPLIVPKRSDLREQYLE